MVGYSLISCLALNDKSDVKNEIKTVQNFLSRDLNIFWRQKILAVEKH